MGSCWATVTCQVPSGTAESPTPPWQVPQPALGSPLLENPAGTGAGAALTSGNLLEPRRSPSPVRPARGCHRPGEAHTLRTVPGGAARAGSSARPSPARMLRRRPGTHLWVHKNRGNLRGDPPCNPRPGLGKPRCSRPCGWRVPPSFPLSILLLLLLLAGALPSPGGMRRGVPPPCSVLGVPPPRRPVPTEHPPRPGARTWGR